MIHLICTNCSNHFFSRETNKEYKCPFCDIQLQPTKAKAIQTLSKAAAAHAQQA